MSQRNVKHQGQSVTLASTRVSDLKEGQLILGPCGQERIISNITVDDAGWYVIQFKNSAKSWTKSKGASVLVVERE